MFAFSLSLLPIDAIRCATLHSGGMMRVVKTHLITLLSFFLGLYILIIEGTLDKITNTITVHVYNTNTL